MYLFCPLTLRCDQLISSNNLSLEHFHGSKGGRAIEVLLYIQMFYNRFEHSFTYSLKPIVSFSKQENNSRQNFGIFDLDNFQVILQYGVLTLCNKLLPEVSSNQL